MTDFGARLRQAREQHGVSLRDIADRTKFSIAALQALERNDPSRLPGGIFARAFVRSYAAEVGLDPEAAVREFVEIFDVEPAVSVADLSQSDSTAGSRDSSSRVSATILTLVLASLVAMAIIFFFARARTAGESSGMTPADGPGTSRRSASPVSTNSALP
jgi:cytoskeletal protein RodZ